MSTFGGVMVEFPAIRVDFFRPVLGLHPPLACFLSHVHTDHLAGLELLKAPFVYCSPATKELLLRLERYPHRLNFALGILESRKQTYKHLQKLLKPIPLETPTRIELEPGKDIQVTLFDANHCTGAVMFLFEGDGKAVLYTGDIRSEPWFVNKLTRNPFLIEYTSGLKTLECIYLDTSNTSPIDFPTKADGIKELLQKVSKYPPDTVFHFTAWTFGYEEVWMALSKALQSPIHVDQYKLRLYQSLRGESAKQDKPSAAFLAHEGPVLTGYVCGNTPQKGCLTDDQTVRLHSCEKGMHCPTINEKTVWIKPIITRTEHGEMAEIGVGGGGGDLAQRPELELDNDFVIDQLLSLFPDTETTVLNDIKSMLLAGSRSTSRAVSLDDMGLRHQENDLSLLELSRIILRSLAEKRSASDLESQQPAENLPRVITFPYSRHSSYPELCDLVKVFHPKDVYACTVDANTWHEGVSIQNLFGKHCSAAIFRHDTEMRMVVAEISSDLEDQQTRTTASAQSSPNVSPTSIRSNRIAVLPSQQAFGGTIRRNSQGLLRPFDASGSEVSIAQKETPPRSISAVSPGSESQSMRRKAILDVIGERDVKRARLQADGPDSSPNRAKPMKDVSLDDIPEAAMRNNIVNIRKILPMTTILTARQALIQSDNDWENAVSLISGRQPLITISEDEIESLQSGKDPEPQMKQTLGGPNTDTRILPTVFNSESPLDPPGLGDNMNRYCHEILEDQSSANVITLGDDEPELFDIDDNSFTIYSSYMFFDYDDQILRCSECGHEIWASDGFCTGIERGCCREGRADLPYVEVIDPEAGPRPAIATTEYSEELLTGPARRTVVGNYLDDVSSAYDSQDAADRHFKEEYDEQDSFIDDESQQDSNTPDGSSSTDGETDWKTQYNQLRVTHNELLNDYGELADEFDDMRRDFLGSDHESASDMEVRDEDGVLIVDVGVPDPIVTELVLSQAQQQSQESEITTDRLRDRAEAFEAASSVDGWHNITMVSTQDNHTHPEIEL